MTIFDRIFFTIEAFFELLAVYGVWLMLLVAFAIAWALIGLGTIDAIHALKSEMDGGFIWQQYAGGV